MFEHFLKGNSLKISHKYNVNLLELIIETCIILYIFLYIILDKKNCKKTKNLVNFVHLEEKKWISKFFGPNHTRNDTLCSIMAPRKEEGILLI